MSFKELIISGIQNQLSDRSIKRSLKKSFKEIDFSKEIKLIRYELSEEKKLDDALQTILSLDLSWKRKAITEILRKIYCDNETYDPIEYVEANGKVRRWILTPHTNQVRAYADFYKHYPKPSLCSFLLSIGGSETQGLSILAEYFHKKHSSDFDSVCSRLGFTQTKQLSVLSSYGIDFQSYHGGAIIGRHMSVLLTKSYDILLNLLNEVSLLNISSENLFLLEITFNSIYPLMVLLDAVCSCMNSRDKLSEDDINRCETNIGIFSAKYRRYFKDRKITPKFHVLESHVIPYMRRFGSLLQFSEETMESFHPIVTKLENLYNQFRDDEKKQYFMFKRRSIKSNALVLDTVHKHEAEKRRRGKKKNVRTTKQTKEKSSVNKRLIESFITSF